MKILIFRLLTFFLLLLFVEGSGTAQTFAPSPDVLSTALNANLTRWAQSVDTNPEYTTYNALANVRAMHYLALAAYHDPGNTVAVNRLLAHIRNVIAGGNEPTCRGTILGWTDNALAQSLTLAKNTPAVWGQLTSAETNKCDWLMRALTVAGNHFQNYDNEPAVCLMNVFKYGGKRNAPNIVEGYVDIMIAAHTYWGGAAAVNQILADFDYDTYLATFAGLGFTNIVFGWTYAYGNTTPGRAQMKALMENGGSDLGGGTINGQGARHPFTFKSYYSPVSRVSYDPFLIYQALAERMYRHITHNRSNSGQAYVLNNRISPMTGLNGMCNEFQGSDGSGERSSVRYTYDGWVNSILTYATLRALNLWGNTPAHKEIDRRIKVGSIDLLYKYKAGYYSRSNGNFSTQTEPTGITFGYVFVKDVWINYLWDRKDMAVLELMAPTLTESFSNAALMGSFADGQFTGEQGLIWNYTGARQDGVDGILLNDTKFINLDANNAGVLSSTLTKPVSMVRFKVRSRSASGSPAVTVTVNGQELRTYSGFGADETDVVVVAGTPMSTGDVLAISNTGDVELIVDNLELEQELSTPVPPTGFAPVNITTDEVLLGWTDPATNETGFQLERRKLPDGDFEVIEAALPANTTQYSDQNVEPESVYAYRLSVFNLAGFSSAVTVIVETPPLVAQDEVELIPVADAYVQAGSTAGSNYGTRTYLNVKWAGASNNTTREAFMRFDLTSFLKPIRRASLRLYAISVEPSGSNPPNPITAKLDLIDQNDWDETTISWTSSRLFTSPTTSTLYSWDPVAGNNVAELNTDLLQDKIGGLLTMKISVLESLLLTLGSREGQTSPIDQRPRLTIYTDHINAPTSLLLSGGSRPVLTWQDNSDNETGFTIQRRVEDGIFTDLGTVGAGVTTFEDQDAEPEVLYAYRVFAANAQGKSAYTNAVEFSGVLPVTLMSFEVKKEGHRTALLSWATTKETNFSRFEIQRSHNLQSWRVLATQVSKGLSDSGVNRYSFSDSLPLPNKNYYRLKMVDIDGSIAFSKIETAIFNAEAPASYLYPSPVSSGAFFIGGLAEDTVSGIELFNASGVRVVSADSYRTDTGVAVAHLPAGIYVVKIKMKGEAPDRISKILIGR